MNGATLIRRASVATVAMVSLAAAGPVAAQPLSPDSLAKLVPSAPFVFVASVISRSVPAVPRAPVVWRLAGLRVLEAIATPPGFPLRRGDRVKLLVAAADAPAVGSRAVIFATGWLADDSLSLIQVDRVVVRTSADWRAVKAGYDSLRLVNRRAALQQSVAGAALVAIAVVDSVVRLHDQRPPIARGEHDPVWARVSITPLRIAKGDSTLVGQRVTLLVPTNRSNMWGHAPRLVRGDTALFMLAAIRQPSALATIDSSARFLLADSVAVRPRADTVLLRSPR